VEKQVLALIEDDGIGDLGRLTPSELKALVYAAAGYTSEQTASELFLSVETIKSQRKAVIEKMRASSMTNALGVFVATAPPELFALFRRKLLNLNGNVGRRPQHRPAPKPRTIEKEHQPRRRAA
jgi:DNA-binding CsgD family transcriptional regulator